MANVTVNGSKLRGFKSVATFTSTDFATQYTSGDAYADSISSPTVPEFQNVGKINGQIVILNKVKITLDKVEAILPQFRLRLFDTAPTPTNDNAPLDISTTDAAKEHEFVDVDGIQGGNVSTYNAIKGGLNRTILLDDDSKSLHGLIEIINDYIPTATEVITITIFGYRL